MNVAFFNNYAFLWLDCVCLIVLVSYAYDYEVNLVYGASHVFVRV